jgi:hypothetical protein
VLLHFVILNMEMHFIAISYSAHHSTLDHHGRTSTIIDLITNYAQSDEAQTTKDTKLKLFAPQRKIPESQQTFLLKRA